MPQNKKLKVRNVNFNPRPGVEGVRCRSIFLRSRSWAGCRLSGNIHLEKQSSLLKCIEANLTIVTLAPELT